ncbi:hypothetical protein BJY01DRAFT_255464 [Aspergillus pseudoustus]|uniref:Protein SQS1 n=1 Tax=Aspergillus pseudoustus TaxID=1810923 RepID=A0ABR4IKM4_9EURO
MQEEARNTEGRRTWRTDTQLRHRAVQFVSAGNIEPARELEPSPDQSQPLEPPDGPATDLAEVERENVTDSEAQQRPQAPEDSSEDEIVFRGRRNGRELATIKQTPDAVTEAQLQQHISNRPSPFSCGRRAVKDAPHASIVLSRDESLDFIRIDDDDLNAGYHHMSDEDQILADYIANMDDGSDDDDDDVSLEEDHDIDLQQRGEEEEEEEEGMIATAAESGSDDLHLESGIEALQHEGQDMPGDSEVEDSADFVSLGRSKPGRPKSIFAPASAFADALEVDPYYGFDIMDFSRPSVRKKAKKGLDYFNLDALDYELGADLLNAWNKDRLKKKSKKKEREQLRTQGLLGRPKNDPDLKAKYGDGIGIEDLKSEIRQFMLSSKNSLSLPPMTKHRRMLIHDMSHALRLTSQSRGKGSSRFPVLSKTSRTPKYAPETISQIDRVLSRNKFSPRALKAWDKSGGRPTKAKTGHNVSYMDGDVVGASAPEIGAENIGRAMLEKMGWSRGTALGAIHNKGILLPVSHVVKNSKAGLG